jgi:hypothetical protein
MHFYNIDIDIASWQIWLVILGWLANIVAGAFAGSGKQAVWLGALLGAILGPLGVVAALGLDLRPQCPVCTGRINGSVKVDQYRRTICQYCRSPLYWDPVTNKPLLDKSDHLRDKNESDESTEERNQ